MVESQQWIAGGKAKFTVQVKGIPKSMSERDVIQFLQQYGRLNAFMLHREVHNRDYADGTAMVKYYHVRDVNRLLMQGTGRGIDVPGHGPSRIRAQLTFVEFMQPARDTRPDCGFMVRYRGGARYDHFREFDEDVMAEDWWLAETLQLNQGRMNRTLEERTGEYR